MSLLQKTCAKIAIPDAALLALAEERLDSLTKPPGSLGRLEELAKNIVAMTGKLKPRIKHKAIFTLAADHGVAEEGVSAFPQEVTAQMVLNFLRKGAAINVLAKHAGARVIVVDMGVAADVRLKNAKKLDYRKVRIGPGTRNFTREPAMSKSDAVKAIEAGIGVFREEQKKGMDICGTGEMGIANTTASSAITACILRKDAREVTGRGTGVDEAGLDRKIAAIEKGLRLHSPDPKDPVDVLAKVGGFEIAGLAGIILAASAARVPVVIDGFISGAAALIAYTLEPKTRHYMIAAHASVEKGQASILQHMKLEPLLNLNLRLGEGTGACLGMGLAEAAVKILNEMATFKSAKVSTKLHKK
ncbi:MAG: nicotinate-nucleotide--dimethylbenzimidazole phosphoribosyltransferase [Candidatus Omnitrophica bacterium]|nr:nicotinate-nucleotide--dimethylbenzimidazole phosphoribosyltransferase [Candidatus Omnitrophota bacterium]